MSQKSIEINIPTVFTEKTMYEIVAKVFLDDNFPTDVSSLDIDLKDLKYIDVAGVTVLSNLIELAQNFKIPVNFNYNDSVASFLIDSGFAQRYIGFPDDNLNKKTYTLPLKVIHAEEVVPHLHYQIVPWFLDCLEEETDKQDITSYQLSSIQTALQEIFNNINDHSNTKIGCYCGYYNKEKRIFKLCISDFGIGIPSKITKLNPHLTESQAIEKACEYGYTTKSTPNNMGAGLDVLLKNTVLANKGSLTIYSSRGIFCAKFSEEEIIKETRAVQEHNVYPGTIIVLEYPIDTIQLDEAQEFSW